MKSLSYRTVVWGVLMNLLSLLLFHFQAMHLT